MKFHLFALAVGLCVWTPQVSEARDFASLETHESEFRNLIWEGDRWEEMVEREAQMHLDEAEIYLNWKKPYPKPPNLSASDIRSVERALKSSELATDASCRLSRDEIAASEIQLSRVDRNVCQTSIGTNGLYKEKEGDRKNPVGNYWLGLPRVSERFGIFIPVGYPNAADVKAGRTGSAIGIHGPLRYGIFASPCAVESSLSRNWTAGCTATGRDTQVINLSKWMVKNWPIQLIVIP